MFGIFNGIIVIVVIIVIIFIIGVISMVYHIYIIYDMKILIIFLLVGKVKMETDDRIHDDDSWITGVQNAAAKIKECKKLRVITLIDRSNECSMK